MQFLKSFALKCKRFTNNEERTDSSQSWSTYHTDLDKRFSKLDFTILKRENIDLRLSHNFFLIWRPFKGITNKNSYFEVAEEALLHLQHESLHNYPTNTCRHSATQPLSLHMGFYKQNLKNSSQRTWKLYDATNMHILLMLKPILKLLSNTYIKTLEDPLNLLLVPVQRFDTVLFKSSTVFHRAIPFTGTRINVSCYS